MASTYAIDVKRKDILSVYPEDLVVDIKKNGRYFGHPEESIEALAKDIDEKGQLQTVLVTVTHDKRLELRAGFRRYLAICLLNKKASDASQRRRIECRVIAANEEEAFLANISENRVRSVTTVIDDAHNIRRLSEHFHKEDAEILAIYGDNNKPKSQAWLDQMRKLLTLSKDEQKAIHSGQISASTGYMLADISPEKREVVFEELKEEIREKGKVSQSSALSVARKSGSLDKQVSLKMPEYKKAWAYLAEHEENKKVKTLAELNLQFVSGEIAEPDFFGAVRELLQ